MCVGTAHCVWRTTHTNENVSATTSSCNCCKPDPDLAEVCTQCADALPVAAFQANSEVQPSPFTRDQLLAVGNLYKDSKFRRALKEEFLDYIKEPDDTSLGSEAFPLTENTNNQTLLDLIHIDGPTTL